MSYIKKQSARRPLVTGWTSEHVARLEELLDAGASAVRAASALGRSIISVQNKARKLGRPFLHKRAAKRARLAREAQVTGQN